MAAQSMPERGEWKAGPRLEAARLASSRAVGQRPMWTMFAMVATGGAWTPAPRLRADTRGVGFNDAMPRRLRTARLFARPIRGCSPPLAQTNAMEPPRLSRGRRSSRASATPFVDR